VVTPANYTSRTRSSLQMERLRCTHDSASVFRNILNQYIPSSPNCRLRVQPLGIALVFEPQLTRPYEGFFLFFALWLELTSIHIVLPHATLTSPQAYNNAITARLLRNMRYSVAFATQTCSEASLTIRERSVVDERH
jgi:hypothetical protein